MYIYIYIYITAGGVGSTMGGKRLFFFSFHLISFKEKGKKKNAELTYIKKKKIETP